MILMEKEIQDFGEVIPIIKKFFIPVIKYQSIIVFFQKIIQNGKNYLHEKIQSNSVLIIKQIHKILKMEKNEYSYVFSIIKKNELRNIQLQSLFIICLSFFLNQKTSNFNLFLKTGLQKSEEFQSFIERYLKI
jgi:hypothetical protein